MYNLTTIKFTHFVYDLMEFSKLRVGEPEPRAWVSQRLYFISVGSQSPLGLKLEVYLSQEPHINWTVQHVAFGGGGGHSFLHFVQCLWISLMLMCFYNPSLLLLSMTTQHDCIPFSAHSSVDWHLEHWWIMLVSAFMHNSLLDMHFNFSWLYVQKENYWTVW